MCGDQRYNQVDHQCMLGVDAVIRRAIPTAARVAIRCLGQTLKLPTLLT
jgi:hypothetical protein